MSAVRSYIVQTDDPDVDGPYISSARDPSTGVRIPQCGESWPRTSGTIPSSDPASASILLRVIKIRAESRDTSMQIWDVRVDYSSNVNVQNQAIDPMTRPARWRWGNISNTEDMRFDLDGKAAENTAHVPLDPPIQIIKNYSVLRLSWNTLSFSGAIQEQYTGSANLMPFGAGYPWMKGRVIPALAGRLARIEVSNQTDWPQEYVTVSVEIVWDHTTPVSVPGKTVSPHDAVVDSTGVQQWFNNDWADCRVKRTKLNEITGQTELWKDEDDKVVYVFARQPVHLDETGQQTDGPAAKMLFKRVHRENWSYLGFPYR